jgi:hypothetical protein
MFIGKYVVHELANFFPMLKGEQYEQLYEDIKEHSLQEPIVLFEGKILDGRNRALIAHKLGLKIKLKDFEDLKIGQLRRIVPGSSSPFGANRFCSSSVSSDASFAPTICRSSPGGCSENHAPLDCVPVRLPGAVINTRKVV